MIAIVDYHGGHGNAVKAVLDELGVRNCLVRSEDAIGRANKLILPDAENFADMIRSLRDGGLVPPLYRASDTARPILGIGRGMHLLLDVSYEDGQHTGLGIVPGKATRFQKADHPASQAASTPHRGWGEVRWSRPCPLTAGLDSGHRFYFDHAYYAEPLDDETIFGSCIHGVEFPALLWHRAIFATQFLIERSEDAGKL
jgi:glutamine amidotransferase